MHLRIFNPVKNSFFVLLFVVIITIMAIATSIHVSKAQEAPIREPETLLPNVDASFTYQGEIEDGGGLVDGSCDFRFGLWDAVAAGLQLGSTQFVNGVVVVNGRFTTTLNDSNQFGSNAFNGAERWLEIDVRCPAGSGSYITLSPRQSLTAAPYAQSLRPGAVVAGDVSGQMLSAINTAGDGLAGLSSAANFSGVYGQSDHTDGFGVYGRNSTSGNLAYLGGSNQAIYAESSNGVGVHIQSADTFGVLVDSAGFDGFKVEEVGNPSLAFSSIDSNGFEVAGAGGHGLYVGRADLNGIRVGSSGETGIMVIGAGSNGLHVAAAGGAGVVVGTANGDGVFVNEAGAPTQSVFHGSTGHGFSLAGAGGIGMYIGHADEHGVYVNQATLTGVYANTLDASGEWGLYTPDKSFAGTTMTNAMSIIAQVEDGAALSTGDIVEVAGLADMIDENGVQMLAVRRATSTSGAGIVGIVAGRMALNPLSADDPTLSWHNAEDPAQSGDFVELTVLGVAQVKITPGSGIQVGQRLTLDNTLRTVRSLKETNLDGIMLTEGAPTIGYALQTPSDDMTTLLIYVTPQ